MPLSLRRPQRTVSSTHTDNDMKKRRRRGEEGEGKGREERGCQESGWPCFAASQLQMPLSLRRPQSTVSSTLRGDGDMQTRMASSKAKLACTRCQWQRSVDRAGSTRYAASFADTHHRQQPADARKGGHWLRLAGTFYKGRVGIALPGPQAHSTAVKPQ